MSRFTVRHAKTGEWMLEIECFYRQSPVPHFWYAPTTDVGRGDPPRPFGCLLRCAGLPRLGPRVNPPPALILRLECAAPKRAAAPEFSKFNPAV